jgi:hypothetical protein
LFHNPEIPRVKLLQAARRYHQNLTFEKVRDALRAVGGDLKPAAELNWRQKLTSAGSILIGKRAYHIFPPPLAGPVKGYDSKGRPVVLAGGGDRP